MHTLAQGPRKSADGPCVLVLLPTRELAQQVEEVAQDYCKRMDLSIVCLYGGASKLPQATALRNGKKLKIICFILKELIFALLLLVAY